MTNNKYNIPEEKPKDTYDKILPENGAGGLFSENGFDEMQKSQNHEIGFKLFRACYWFMYFFSMSAFVYATNDNDTAFTVYSIALMAAASVFHIVYSAKLSAKGVMNPTYAAAMGKPASATVYVIVLILGLMSVVYTSNPISVVILIMPGIMVLCDCFFARRNNKVLEKMLKENEEE